MRIRTKLLASLVFGLLLVTGGSAHAQTFTTTTNQGDGNETASAVFSFTGANTCGAGHACVQVILGFPSASFTVYHNASILNGLFFEVAGGTSTSLVGWSAITPGTLANPGGCTGGAAACTGSNINVGREWAYGFSSTGYTNAALTTTARFGLSAAGYSTLAGWNGANPVFNGLGTAPNLGGYPGNIDFGIVASTYTGGSGTAGTQPLEKSSVTFLYQLPTGVSSLSISNVTFAYGTNPDGSAKAPEPASIALFGTGLAAVAFLRRRKSAPLHAEASL